MLVSFRVPDDESHGSIRQGSADMPSSGPVLREVPSVFVGKPDKQSNIRGWETDR